MSKILWFCCWQLWSRPALLWASLISALSADTFNKLSAPADLVAISVCKPAAVSERRFYTLSGGQTECVIPEHRKRFVKLHPPFISCTSLNSKVRLNFFDLIICHVKIIWIFCLIWIFVSFSACLFCVCLCVYTRVCCVFLFPGESQCGSRAPSSTDPTGRLCRAQEPASQLSWVSTGTVAGAA